MNFSPAMSLHYIENKTWLRAIVDDNKDEVENILQTSDDETKKLLLNGEFPFPEPRLRIKSCLCEYDKDNSYTYCHAWHMALALASKEVVHIFIKHGVESDLLDINGGNCLHLICYVAFMQEDVEDEMIEMYQFLQRCINPSMFQNLLQHENSDGLRPLEYAMNLGVCGLAFTILRSKGVFLCKEDLLADSIIGWMDITDYELTGYRCLKSPFVFLTMFSASKIENNYFPKLFSTPFLQEWISVKFRVMKPMLAFWFFLRILFMVIFYETDSLLIYQEEKFIQNKTFTNTMNNMTCLQDEVPEGYDDMFYVYIPTFYLYFYSSGVLLLDFYEYLQTYKQMNWAWKTPLGKKSMAIQVSFYKFNQAILYLTITCNLTVRLLRLNVGCQIPFIIDDICYIIISAAIIWSIMQFVQLLPVLGQFTTALTRMCTHMFGFLLPLVYIQFFFYQLFSRQVNLDRTVCVEEFTSLSTSLYSTFRIILHLIDFRKYDNTDVISLYTLHVIYVFVTAILFINLLIAVFSSTVSWVEEYKNVVLTIQRLYMVVATEIRLSKLCDKLFRRYTKQYFRVSNDRIYLTEECKLQLLGIHELHWVHQHELEQLDTHNHLLDSN